MIPLHGNPALAAPPLFNWQLEPAAPHDDPQIRDFSRTVAEIEWLLVILVLLYHFFRGAEHDSLAIYLGLLIFSGGVIVLHYLNLLPRRGRWRLAAETWLMIVFITWVLYHTGRLDSPLLNLYLLPVIVSALTLGSGATLLQMGLIAACYVLLGYNTDASFFSALTAGTFAADLAPMLLVAYITTMLSADILNAMARIKLVAETDELTGLYNVRAFRMIAERELKLAGRYDRAYSLMMVDSDSLKHINDTYGHEAGDRLIRSTAHAIREVVKGTDVVARYGGDEFVCLFPDARREFATPIGERIRLRIAAVPLQVGGGAVPITVSIGVATYTGHGDTLEALLRRADQALYHSKSSGRNQVTVWSPAMRTAA
jgi:diguanylate cyclase (GGDEF)-like protein